MKQIILGTAGHIDHGKTSLVRALTGTDTDRLKEEKERGITIELGFAVLALPSGQHVGIVDVPGHEKFVKNMVAGAAGIDIVAMIIAADEGVMPQTREHLEICSLLGIRNGLVVLTKTDMVDEEWLELVTEEVKDFIQGTFLSEKPVVSVSSATGRGLDDLLKALDDQIAQIPEKQPSGLFRLPVDRVFSMKGFGTVITGSLVSGKIRTGETIMIYPTKLTSKIRGIQVHNDRVAEAHAGMRTAVNFQGLDKTAIRRGDILARPDTLKPSYMADVLLTFLKSNKKPIKNRARVRFHTGTSEILGNLILLETDELEPGETAVAQLRLDSPVALVRDDHFVIRSYSPIRTIGGGIVLNPICQKHKRFRPDTIAGLKRITDGSPENLIACHAEAAGTAGVSFTDLRLMTNLTDKELDRQIQGMLSKKILVILDKENQVYIHHRTLDDLRERIREQLEYFHRRQPLKPGMFKEELKSKFPRIKNTRLFNQVLDRMVKENAVVSTEEIVRLSGHRVSLEADQENAKNKMIDIYAREGLTPPYFRDIAKDLELPPQKAKDILMHLVEEKKIVKTKDDLFFDAHAVEDLKNRLIDYLDKNGEITTPQFKELTGASRKYVIPLIEYFDARNITIRIGDIRKLRRA
ncbi:MAG: selenocysteine-specific translation elongation factor [Desulfobacterales bacterium]